MKFKQTPLLFWVLGAILLAGILLPLLGTLVASISPTLWLTLWDEEIQHSLGLTLGASAISTLLGALGGIPLAYLLARSQWKGKQWIEAVLTLPVIVPHTAAGVALLLVLGRNGWLGGPLANWGWYFTDQVSGVVAAMMFVSVPYLVEASQAAFALIDRELEHVAYLDGAGSWQVFWYVALPQAWRGIAGGMMMMWARGISEFGAVVILAYHPKVMPTLVYERFEGFGLAAAQPAAGLLIVVVFLILAGIRCFLKSNIIK